MALAEAGDIDRKRASVTELARANQTPYNGFVSIVTKTGDKGETSLMYGRRVSKIDPRVDIYGSVDELNAALGLARALSQDSVSDQILAAQKDLIVVMGELATAR